MTTLLDPNDPRMKNIGLRTDFEPDQDFTLNEDFKNLGPAESFDPSANQDVEGLMFIGYLVDNFTVFGHSFSIRTLRRGERLAIGQIVAEYEGTIGLVDAMQTAYVAACLTLVDGHALTSPLGIEEDKNPISWIQRNFAVVCKWYDPVLEAVYEKYSNLMIRQTQAFLALQGKS